MGSLGAMREGGKDRCFWIYIGEEEQLIPEGIEGLVLY